METEKPKTRRFAAYVIAWSLFVVLVTAAPSNLSAPYCGITEDTEQRHEYIDKVRDYNYAYPSPITEETDEQY